MPFLFITSHGVVGAGRTTSVSFDCTQLNSLGTQNLVIFALPSRPSCFDSDVEVYKRIVSDLKMRIKSSEKSEKKSGAEEWQELHTTPIGILELVRKLGQVNNANSAFIFLKNLLGNCHCSAYFTKLQILAAGRHFLFLTNCHNICKLSFRAIFWFVVFPDVFCKFWKSLLGIIFLPIIFLFIFVCK